MKLIGVNRLACAKHRCVSRTISLARTTTSRCLPTPQRQPDKRVGLPDLLGTLGVVASASTLLLAIDCPSAAAETLNPAYIEVFKSWVSTVQELGPLGPLLFISTVAAFECIPLFPTQPLSLASGLLFGVYFGALYNVVGVTCAATLAFLISRTVGRELAQRIVAEETEGNASGAIKSQLDKVKAVIADGTPVEQFTAILLLRLTPVVPFSASNYVLGMTPVSYAPYFAATVLGQVVWSALYASVGGAGRALMLGGMDLEDVLSSIQSTAGDVSEKAAIVALVAGGVVAAYLIPKAISDNARANNRL